MRNRQLIKARKAAGLTRVEFALLLNVNTATVYRWETNKYKMPYARAKQIVGYLSNYGLKMNHLGYM